MDNREPSSSSIWTRPQAPPPPSGLAVYYPFELVEFLGFFEDDESRAAGELLMAFLDSSGCRVTLRARRSAVAPLMDAKSSVWQEAAASARTE